MDRGVHLDAEHGHQRLVLAITGQQHDPGCNSLVGRDQRQLLAVADDASRLRWLAARRTIEELGLPLPSAPAMPTISPSSRVKLTGPNDWP